MNGQSPAPKIEDLEFEEDEPAKPKKPRGWRGLMVAAVPGVVAGFLNYCDADHSKAVIAQESARVDVSVWPEIVEHRKRVERLTERLDRLESRLTRDELDKALERTTITVHTSSTPKLEALPADKPAQPSKQAVDDKRKELF